MSCYLCLQPCRKYDQNESSLKPRRHLKSNTARKFVSTTRKIEEEEREEAAAAAAASLKSHWHLQLSGYHYKLSLSTATFSLQFTVYILHFYNLTILQFYS